MMALGSSYRAVGSSSSSNLSASAPPFTVDRSFAKTNSRPFPSYPESHFPSLLHPALQLQETPCNPNSEPVLIDFKTLDNGSRSLYGFPDSQSSKSMSTEYINFGQAAAFEPYTIDQCSAGLPASFVDNNSYYSPYVPSLDPSFSAGSNQPTYDLLSDCVATQFSGLLGADFAQSVSQFETSPPWAGFWDEVSDRKRGGSLYSKDYLLPDLSTCEGYTEQGVEGMQSFSISYPTNDYFESARSFPLGSTSTSGDQASPHIGEVARGSMPNPWVPKPYIAKAEKLGFSSCPFAIDALTEKSFPAVVVSPLSGDSSFGCSAVVSKGVSNKDAFRRKYSSEYDQFSLESSCSHLDSMYQLFENGGGSDGPCGTSSKRSEYQDIKSDYNDVPGNSSVLYSMPLSHVLNSCDLHKRKPEDADAMCSVEKSSDNPDIHNPAVDSPCWKGAPSAHLSPFRSSDLVGPELLLKDLAVHNNLDKQCFRNQGVNTTDVVHVCDKSDESSSAETRLLVENILPGDWASSPMKERLSSEQKTDQAWHEIQFVDGNTKSGKEFPKKAEADGYSKVSFTAEQSQKKGESTFDGNLRSSVVGEHSGASVKEGVSTLLSNRKDEFPSVHYINVATSMVGKPLGRDRDPTVDVTLLVHTMKNLSELLSYLYSSNPASIAEQDYATLNGIINNIKACLRLERDVHSTPSGGMLQKGSPSSHEDVPHVSLEKSNSVIRSGREDLLEPFLLKHTANTSGDVDVSQAIKRVLCQNFALEDELDARALFYRNLWLEAEAALCCFTVNSRFHNMKMEMSNCVQSGKVGETSEVPSCVVSPDVHGVDKLGSQSKYGLDFGVRSPEFSGADIAFDSVEIDTSVMDRFQILSSRGEKFKDREVERQGSSADRVDELEASATSGVQEIPEFLIGNPSLTDCKDLLSPGGMRSGQDLGIPGKIIQETIRLDPLEEECELEASVFARFNILKSRIDRLNASDEDLQWPVLGEEEGQTNSENIMDDRMQGQLSQFGVPNTFPESKKVQVVNVQLPTTMHAQSCEADGNEHGLQFRSHARSPNQQDMKKVNQLLLSPLAGGQDLRHYITIDGDIVEPNGKRLNLEIHQSVEGASKTDYGIRVGVIEGWYDCPTADWERISKDDFMWQK